MFGQVVNNYILYLFKVYDATIGLELCLAHCFFEISNFIPNMLDMYYYFGTTIYVFIVF